MASKSILTLDFSQVDKYVVHLKTLNYNEMNNGMKSIVNQVANDVKDTYHSGTPLRNPRAEKARKGTKNKSGKYGATPGNLRRSLRVFKKRQPDPFVIEYTVGFKTHKYGTIVGKKVIDGYYGWMVNYGKAGKGKGHSSNRSKGFIQTARKQSNVLLNNGLSDRAEAFIQRKLAKMLGTYNASGSQFKDKAYEKALRAKYGG
jgi:hypothetical protein